MTTLILWTRLKSFGMTGVQILLMTIDPLWRGNNASYHLGFRPRVILPEILPMEVFCRVP